MATLIKIEPDNDCLTDYQAHANGAEIALLQLTESETQPGKLQTEYISVKSSVRGQGIASRLLDAARADYGYTPAPHWILDTSEAQAFWAAKGFPTNIPTTIQPL